MDSWPRRPFGLHSSRVPYTSTARVSSSSTSPSLGSSRLSSREMGLNSERFPRASSTYKTDLDQQTSCLRRSSRDFSGSDSRSTSWKLPPSLTSSTRSYDHPWAESSLSSRRKLTDSEGRVGMRSALLNPSDDGDPNRSPLSYSSRGLYSRKPSTLLTGSSQSSNGLSSGRGEKQSDTSSWSSNHSRLSTRRDYETKNELGVTGLGDGRVRTGLASSLYPTERLTSTYAQGARPKETTYSPYSSSSSSSSSSTARESSLNRHTSSSTSHRSLLGRNLGNRTTSHYLNVSSTMRSSEERTGNPLLSSDMSSSQSSHTPRFAASQIRAEATPPHRPALDGDEPGSYRACRRLLSRIFSRQSSQDSSSGSSSVSSFDDNGSSSTDGDSTDGSRGARNCRAVLTSVHGNSHGGSRSGVAQPRMPSGREPGVGGHNNARNEVSASSWLSSAPPGRRSPLLSRRHARDETTHSSTSLEGGYAHPQHLPRRWAYLQRNASQAGAEDEEEEEDDEEDDDDDDEEEEEKEGAVGFGAYGEKCPCKLEEEALPEVQGTADDFSARRRVGMRENYSASSASLVGVENVMDDEREKTVSSADQEKLRKIKERLLLEESDDDEGDLCRICQMGEESASNPLIQPCHCTGSLQYVHQECIKRWLCSKIHSGTNLESVTTCELCKKKLHLSIDDFDVEELYRTYVQSECDNFISSSLHLVGRFFNALEEMDLAGFNLVRILHEQMENSEVSHSESEGEIQDNRPSISLSDLEDDSEEEF